MGLVGLHYVAAISNGPKKCINMRIIVWFVQVFTKKSKGKEENREINCQKTA